MSRESEDGGLPRYQVQKSILSGIARKSARVLKRHLPWNTDMEVMPNTEPQGEVRSRRSIEHPVQGEAQTSGEDNVRCMFESYTARLPTLHYEDMLHTGNKHRNTHEKVFTRSTFQEIRVANQRAGCAPLKYLFKVIIHDTLTILRSIDTVLTQMDLDMLDDELLQSNIDDWLRILNRIRTELRDMRTTLPEFAAFIKIPRKTLEANPGPETGIKTCGDSLRQCTSRMTKVSSRADHSQRSLMTAMSLVESKRGISEAESVTKLTELAFFFIPLTFAASLFSMQVKELDAATTSVALFVAVAFSITLCSYTLRLVIRSSWLLRVLRRWKKDIRATTESPSGAPIPTSAVLKWIWSRFAPYTHIGCILVANAALMAGLWTRSLQEGIKVAVTIALALLGFAVIMLMISLT